MLVLVGEENGDKESRGIAGSWLARLAEPWCIPQAWMRSGGSADSSSCSDGVGWRMDYDGLFGKGMFCQVSSALWKWKCPASHVLCSQSLHCPPLLLLSSLPTTPHLLFTLDLSGSSSVNGRRKEVASERSFEHLRPNIWCISCSAS